ncbi:MAG TPA: hypothetical protein VNI20_11690, partial [Fimbriimonadaceae bacterium]|nr:hypothetical protein [Fimbriimonadaceae bacterium]
MNITQCDACGIELDEGQTDGESVRIALPGDDTEEQLYLYIKVGDDDGEPVDKHYCPSCAANMLKLAIENEESGVGNMDWAKGIDL